jgi:hypothetical protein
MTQLPPPPAVTPALPQAPAAPRVGVALPGVAGTRYPLTATDIAALRERTSQLSNQLNSADARRREVQRSLRGAIGADKAGLEARIGVLDARIARLESDIDENSSQLASLDVTRQSVGTAFHWGPDTGNNISDNAMPLAIVFVLFVLFPLAIALSRSIWKRGSRLLPLPQSADTAQRLDRIEQSVEAIAIEIERVAEGQRFVTRLMSEGRGALGPGQPVMAEIPLAAERVAEPR